MINKSIRKVDSESIITGKPIYTEDIIYHKDALIIKILRSPYAYAKIKSIDTSIAKKVEGIVDIYTYEDVPNNRYTYTSETYPESSPYDMLILEDIVRYVGDEVAIIAAENEDAAIKAMKLIKVDYEVLKPIINMEDAENNETIIHEEDDVICGFDFGYDNKKNIVSKFSYSKGDIQKELNDSHVIINSTYHTQPQSHCMMETYRAHSYIDSNDRLTVISPCHSPFHMRRQISKALNLPLSKIRIIKPRVGGSFGGKSIALTELYSAFVTLKTKRASTLIYTRGETFEATNTRHAMKFDVAVGSDKEGNIKGIDIKLINNTGAYGGNGPCITMVCTQNVLSMYYDKVPSVNFEGKTVYTNTTPAGAMRGYGSVQGAFAIESAINELSQKLNMDPTKLRVKNTINGPNYKDVGNKPIRSCELHQCIEKGKKMINWDDKYPRKDIGRNKVRAVGMGLGSHVSGAAGFHKGMIAIRMDEDGTYKVLAGSADLGGGSDTILAQIACECLNTSIEKVSVYSGDTETCPFDSGAGASCTTNVTGGALIKACNQLRDKILIIASKKLDIDKDELDLDFEKVYSVEDKDKFITLSQIGMESVSGGDYEVLYEVASNGILESPMPFVAGFAEIELDKNTGEYKLIDFSICCDSGNIINPNLARIQVEGGITKGIGLSMYEDPKISEDGKLLTSNFLQYKVPSRKDIGDINVEFAKSYDPFGPCGAKSLGEIAVHAAAPAIANALYNAANINMRTLPMTFEKVYEEMKNN